MKKLIPIVLLLSQLVVLANTAPVFPVGTSFASAFTNSSISGSRSIIVADIFGNGKPALIAANSGTTTLSVLTNNGSGIFGLNTTLTVGYMPYSVVATNVTGSGYVDLVCANYGGNTLTVLTNNGLGAFTTSDTLTLKSSSDPYSVAAADIFGTGKPALICANYEFNTLTVLTNAGGGIFGSNATLNVGSLPECVIAADVYNTGTPALICADYGSSQLTVLTNNGSGVFGLNATLNVGSAPESVTAADIFGNGKLALISANYGNNTLTVLTNNGSAFHTFATLNVGSEPDSVVAADVNGDGSLDLVCANYLSGSLIVLTNNGSGNFVAACTNGVYGDPYCVATGNVFGNGKPDLLAVGNSGLTVLSNTTALYSRTFTVGSQSNLTVSATGSPTPVFGTTNVLPAGVFFKDNGNGTATLAGTPVIGSGGVYNLTLTASNSVEVVTQAVTLTINQQPIFPGYAFVPASTNSMSSYTYFITSANLFGNGQLALICANTENNKLTVLTNAGGGIFSSNATLNVGNEPDSVVAADVYNNGKPALICANAGSGSLTVLTNNGKGIFGLNATLNVGGEPEFVVAADIFGTGKQALICANASSDTLSVLTNNGSTFQTTPATTYTVGSEPVSVVAADVNGDGHVDLICANVESSTLSVLTNNGSGHFVTSDTITLKSDSGPVSVTLADIYNNGNPALICANEYANTLMVLTNAGGGIFGSNVTYSVQYGSPVSVAAADVNGDGHVDLICQNENNALTIFTNNGSGRFAAVNVTPPLESGTEPLSFLAADVNGDGRVDLICGSLFNGPKLTVLTNAASLKVTYTESSVGVPLTPPLASGYPAPSVLTASGTLPGGVTFSGGVLSGTPNPGTAGTYNLVLTQTNIFGTSPETLTLIVNPAVVASTYTLYADENIFATVSTNTLQGYDSDRDGYALNITAVSATSTNGGTVVLNSGLITYTPVTGFTGIDAFTYTIVDSAGDTAQGTVKVDVQSSPSAQPYPLATDENMSQAVSTNTLLSYDNYDYFSTGIPAVSATSTNGGTVMLDNPSGNVIYTPVNGFIGQDQFTYTLVDSEGGTNVGVVLVTVYPLPVAGSYTLSTPQNTLLAIPIGNVLNNDSDAGGLPLSIPAVTTNSLQGGAVWLDNSGNLDYAPATNFTGQDAFTYTLADNVNGAVQGTVSVIVTAAGSPPLNTLMISQPGAGNQLGLKFTGTPGQSYNLQSATNVAGPYVDVPPPVTADPNGLVTNSISLPPGTLQYFYRIQLNP